MVKEVAVREPSEYLRRRSPREESGELKKDSLFSEEFYQQVHRIPITDLVPYKNQARIHFDEEKILALSQTIREHGVRQPLTIIPSENTQGLYEVVSGERRLRAAKLAGLDRVPCIIIHDSQKARRVALIENLQREDLHPIEEGIAYKALLEEGLCGSQLEISQRLGVSEGQVSERLRLASLPREIVDELISKRVTRRADLRKIMNCVSEDEMWMAVHIITQGPELAPIHSSKIRLNKSKLFEIKLVGDQIEVRRGNMEHIKPDLVSMIHQALLNMANEIKPQKE